MVLNCFYKERVLTKEEFFEFYDRHYGDNKEPLQISSKLKSCLVFVLANIIWIEKVAAANINKIDSMGITMLGMVQQIGYWLCLLMCIMEIIRNMMQGDTRTIGRSIVKYTLGFGALYFLPSLFDTIREVFS